MMRRQKAELVLAIGAPALGLLIYLVSLVDGC
jgi:hypothetical protein